ncbi:MAG: serine/threonine-protein kinase [Polyangiaceae bacterium]
MTVPAPGRGTTNAFGKYQLLADLGHGGMADVYLAVARGPVGFNKLVVIKRLRPHLAEEPEFLAMFLDEARLAARLNHPNVVQTNEVGEEHGSYFIAMEYLDGQPLHRIMHRAARRGMQVPLEAWLRILCDALAGLHHAHELTDFDGTVLCVVHRDASPHNVFVTYDGQTKLVDFGIAKAASRTAETWAGVLKGKVAYMAPEQARCADVDRRADLFSIGVILWELLAQERLWRGLSDVEILERLAAADVPRLRSVRPELPVELDEICARALAIRAEDRFASAAELRDALERYAAAHLPRCGPNELGRIVADLFADRRQELRVIIERQLRGVTVSGDAAGWTGARPPQLEHVVQDARDASGPSPVESGPRPHSEVDAQQRHGMSPSGGLPRLEMPSLPGEGTPSAVGGHRYDTGAGASAFAATLAPPSRRGPLLVLAAAALRGAVLALVVMSRRGRDPQATVGAPPEVAPPAAAAPAPTAASSVAQPPPQADVEVRISARPGGAKVFIDDAPVGAGDFVGRFPADSRPHQVRIEAPGHLPHGESAVFDKDVVIDVVLEAQPAKAPGPRLPPVAPPKATGRTKRKLDPTDPWK